MIMRFTFVFAACAALFLSSCANTSVDGVRDTIAPTAAVTTAIVISKAKVEDRAATAEKFLRAASLLEEAVSEDGLNGARIAALVSEAMGNDNKYAGYAASIGLLFENYSINAGAGQAADTIRSIVTGIRAAAQPYL